MRTEATFTTVLLRSSTSSGELVKQAIRRFRLRLPAGEDATDYYLTLKRLEGSPAVLGPEEKPLVIFRTLVRASLDLPMNDFTDDTAVKIHLNKRSESASDEGGTMEEGDTTTNNGSVPGDGEAGEVRLRPHPQNLNTFGVSVPSQRFSSPSFCFPLQLLIYPDDLPDNMVLDPLTEAIVFKDALRDRTQAAASFARPFRSTIFIFPKNITVAEVIELGLERFDISDGVVDGGDDSGVEDKNTKRCSSSRVHLYSVYLSTARVGSVLCSDRLSCSLRLLILERELMPSGKVIDSYPRPANYRPADRELSGPKRRSIDSIPLLGSPDNVPPGDPVFVLRRVIVPRTSLSRHLPSTLLDEVVLQLPGESIPVFFHLSNQVRMISNSHRREWVTA